MARTLRRAHRPGLPMILAAVAALSATTSHAQVEPDVIADPPLVPGQRFGLLDRIKCKLIPPPFEAPVDSLKGLASKIRAEELDIKNRVRAVEYLADLDCTVFPEAKAMLVQTMLDDDWEPVRFRAARGLRDMLSRHSCGPLADEREDQTRLEKKIVGNNDRNEDRLKDDRKDRRREARRCGCKTCQQVVAAGDPNGTAAPCHCTGCCDEDTLNALAKVAYEKSPEGCPFEESYRVRAMAVEAIEACGIPCDRNGPYYQEEEQGPMLEEVAPLGVVPPRPTVTPPPIEETVEPRGEQPGQELDSPPAGEQKGQELRAPDQLDDDLAGSARDLDTGGFCLVSLKQGRKVPADRAIFADYHGRRYYFASDACRRAFVQQPRSYAVAFGGCDPVDYVTGRDVVEGRYLVLHEGRFYMFSNTGNYETFQADPARFGAAEAPKPVTTPVVPVFAAVGVEANGGEEDTPQVQPTSAWRPASRD